MACVRATPTPNPDAMKFTLDISLPERLLAKRGDDIEDGFTRALLAVDGVASVFGVNDFVTVTRVGGADWNPIVCAVEEAAATYLPTCPGAPSSEAVEQARALLREATRRPATTAVEIQGRSRHRRDS
jgi:Scaffold protein Nfu/NifU N terminal